MISQQGREIGATILLQVNSTQPNTTNPILNYMKRTKPSLPFPYQISCLSVKANAYLF